jgi:HSP20 family molecular chaperone IbpA
MTRMSHLTSPLFLGFEEMERLIDRVGKGGDGYPPYNIERIRSGSDGNGQARAQPAAQGPAALGPGALGEAGPDGDLLRITLAVAGFKPHQIEITVEENQLNIRGRQEDDKSRQYIHRGIAARQFSRTFVLADGIEVRSADLSDGLLSIDLVRRQPERSVRRIEIGRPGGREED